MLKICPFCKKSFETNRKRKIYCSPECQKNNNSKYYQKVRFINKPNCVCEYCGVEFFKHGSVESKHSFCSRLCQNRFQARAAAELASVANCICDNCGVEYKNKKSKIERDELHFCCNECRFEYIAKNLTVSLSCVFCGKEFKTTKYRFENCNSRFCSVECFNSWQRRFYLKTTCSFCGKDIYVDKTRQIYNKTGMFFCSNECANKVLLYGENNPNYKGISDITKTLRAHYMSYQRGKIFAKYDKRCAHCGGLAEEVHHIYPVFMIVNDAISQCDLDLSVLENRLVLCNQVISDESNIFNSEDNLIAVCKKCHNEIYHFKGWLSTYDEIDNQQPSQNIILEGSETTEAAQ